MTAHGPQTAPAQIGGEPWVPTHTAAGEFSWKQWLAVRKKIQIEGDTLLNIDPADFAAIEKRGGRLSKGSSSYTTDSPVTIGAGYSGPSYTSSGNGFFYPLLGCLPIDEFTIEFEIKSPGGAFSTIPSGSLGDELMWFGHEAGQRIAFWRGSGNLAVAIMDVTGVTNFQQVTVAINDVTDWPADTWVHFGITYKSNVMKVYINDVLRGTSGTFAGTLRPFGAGSRRDESGGFVLNKTGVAIAGIQIKRYARTLNTRGFGSLPTLTIDCGTTTGAWNNKLTGIVDHGTNFARAGSLTADNAQYAAAAANGCKFVRLTEHNERAVPTVSGGVITGYDWTNYDAWINQWKALGYTGYGMIGYTPAALGANATVDPSSHALFAQYACDVIDRTINVLGMPMLPYWSFWNEPDGSVFSTMTQGQFVALWVTVAQAIQADARLTGVVLGGIDGLDQTYNNAVMDAAATNSLPFGGLFIHDYSTSLQTILKNAKARTDYATSKGFPNTPIILSEYACGGSDTKDSLSGAASDMDIYARPIAGAWSHHAIKQFYDYGLAGATFFRLGQMSVATDAEQGYGMLGRNNTPYPVWAAFSMMWQHSGNRLSASSNWPSYNVLASKDTSKIVATYDSHRFDRQSDKESEHFHLNWQNLPSTFGWKHYRMDTRYNTGRPVLIGQGNQTDLPTDVTMGGVGVGCFVVTF